MRGNQKPLKGWLPQWHLNNAGIPAPVGAWVMNEGGGGTVFDLSGNGNDGTFAGGANQPTWVPNGINFDGADYISVPNSGSINITGDQLTIVSRVLASGLGSDIVMVSKNTWQQYKLGKNAADGVRMTVSATGVAEVDGDTALSINTWHTIAGVYNGVNIKVFLDGLQDGVPGALTGGIDSSANGMTIGSRSDPTSYWEGSAEYVYIYNQALSPAQIAYLHTNPYYAWDYIDDTLIAIIAGQAAAEGVTIPVFWHHYDKNIGR